MKIARASPERSSFFQYNFTMTLPDLEPLIEIEEDTEQETAEEPLYRVLIHNDEVTPMDFVVTVLRNIFKLSAPAAVEVMYTAHHTGLALVQVLPKAEAESRIAKAQFAAGMEGYPLKFSMEPE
jgi:ATP-dependent Clp protease adaptor protein ClpS